eukprot:RCo026213
MPQGKDTSTSEVLSVGPDISSPLDSSAPLLRSATAAATVTILPDPAEVESPQWPSPIPKCWPPPVLLTRRNIRTEVVVAVLFLLSSMFANTFMLNYVHFHMPDPMKAPPLPDLLQGLVPPVQLGPLSGLLFAALPLLTLFCGVYFYGWEMLPFVVRGLMVWGSSMYLRIVALAATQLPPTTDWYCRYDYPDYPLDFPHPIASVLMNTVIGVVTLGTGNVHCGDLFFSGHTVFICVCWMAMLSYMLPRSLALAGLATVLAVAKMTDIIIERNHYTIDVLVSLYITVTVWHMMPEHLPLWLTNPVLYIRETWRYARGLPEAVPKLEYEPI